MVKYILVSLLFFIIGDLYSISMRDLTNSSWNWAQPVYAEGRMAVSGYKNYSLSIQEVKGGFFCKFEPELANHSGKCSLENDNLTFANGNSYSIISLYNNLYQLSPSNGQSAVAINLSKKGNSEVSSKSPNNYASNARELNDNKNFKAAIKIAEKGIQIDSKCKDCWFQKAFAHGNLGEYQKSLDAYDKYLELDPEDEIAINNRKWVDEQMNGR